MKKILLIMLGLFLMANSAYSQEQKKRRTEIPQFEDSPIFDANPNKPNLDNEAVIRESKEKYPAIVNPGPFTMCMPQMIYQERDLKWHLSMICGGSKPGYWATGYFDSKTGRMHDEIVDWGLSRGSDYIIRMECLVKPEWGRDYIDKKCYDGRIKKLEADMRRDIKEKQRVSVFRSGQQRIGEDRMPLQFK